MYLSFMQPRPQGGAFRGFPTSKAAEKRPGDEVAVHGAPFTYLV